MSAELLRRAVAEIRADDLRSDFEEAVADWLEEVAERQKPLHYYNRRSRGWTGARFAKAVARAYLGELGDFLDARDALR